ncbi:hypothetical protein ACIBI9_45530 [Nonomuraea sp. NPDC050451]|uniref:hypothetical protein n=1 Tax=Nonomuraea sp. NPDC050451 TaxID=3364364 RepID=UPI0037A38785
MIHAFLLGVESEYGGVVWPRVPPTATETAHRASPSAVGRPSQPPVPPSCAHPCPGHRLGRAGSGLIDARSEAAAESTAATFAAKSGSPGSNEPPAIMPVHRRRAASKASSKRAGAARPRVAAAAAVRKVRR